MIWMAFKLTFLSNFDLSSSLMNKSFFVRNQFSTQIYSIHLITVIHMNNLTFALQVNRITLVLFCPKKLEIVYNAFVLKEPMKAIHQRLHAAHIIVHH